MSKTKICRRQKIQKWKSFEDKKGRLTSDLALDRTGGVGGPFKHNDNYWKFQIYQGNNLGYDILYVSVNSDQEEKERNLLNGNRIINLNNFIKNIDNFLVCK